MASCSIDLLSLRLAERSMLVANNLRFSSLGPANGELLILLSVSWLNKNNRLKVSTMVNQNQIKILKKR